MGLQQGRMCPSCRCDGSEVDDDAAPRASPSSIHPSPLLADSTSASRGPSASSSQQTSPFPTLPPTSKALFARRSTDLDDNAESASSPGFTLLPPLPPAASLPGPRRTAFPKPAELSFERDTALSLLVPAAQITPSTSYVDTQHEGNLLDLLSRDSAPVSPTFMSHAGSHPSSPQRHLFAASSDTTGARNGQGGGGDNDADGDDDDAEDDGDTEDDY